ncbi:glutaredoxin family protein [Methanothrix sp.]|uniref:glutaredoxin family protein n=1 Tax=Methanothrix sp. TaxID=90426 RepID=UPI002B9B031F|nr:glutaredoxin family protein [Methanothrix sp.]HOK58754.1 glutaredoxin family protein [Methanothrix sp.]HOL42965.1 glutaredoxin family protein [Methanothrix sp.]HPO87968.1 glutaredoxin family protein [Methanothrix sp.]
MRCLACRIYTTPDCPRCEQLKAFLERRGVSFEVVDMTTAEALTELRVNGVFTMSAPVLEVNGRFYTTGDLFDGDRLKEFEL